MSSATATGSIAARATVARAGESSRWLLGPLLAPSLLLLLGAVPGYAFTLDRTVANERLVGLIVAALLSLFVALGLRGVRHAAPLLAPTAAGALLAGGWIIAASGPDVFRGPVGSVLQAICRPLFGLARVTDSVDVANTRFIIGYNGLADLCLVTAFAAGALLLDRPGRRLAAPLLLLLALSLVLLVGTGARGGLVGLAAAVCAIGLYAWPRRFVLLELVLAPVGVVLVAIGIFDKGIEFSSTAGRLTYWSDLSRLLVEYPLTGVGLGLDTANRVALQYEINPDPDRIFYAHNTFVQAYLEQGPAGALGMLLVPLLALAAALIARRYGVGRGHRPLLLAGLGIVGGLEAHGLTDQVVTTNVGTALVLVGLAAVIASLSPEARRVLGRWCVRATLVVAATAAVALLALIVWPVGRAQVLLDVGGLRLNQALVLDPQSPERQALLAAAEGSLSLARAQAPDHPGVLRELAYVQTVRFEDEDALAGLRKLSSAPNLDAFDRLQIAHRYRDYGLVTTAYTWAAEAYAAWGRPPEDAVMQAYAQATLNDSRARTLATQAEAAMRARTFSQAHTLFVQALTFESDNAYLHDRVGAAQRAVDRYGG